MPRRRDLRRLRYQRFVLAREPRAPRKIVFMFFDMQNMRRFCVTFVAIMFIINTVRYISMPSFSSVFYYLSTCPSLRCQMSRRAFPPFYFAVMPFCHAICLFLPLFDISLPCHIHAVPFAAAERRVIFLMQQSDEPPIHILQSRSPRTA